MSEAQADEVELSVIRQSFRCFWLGAIGLIPGVGVALAWQSLAGFKRICAVSGEAPSKGFPIALFAGALMLTPFLHVGVPQFADIVMVLLFTAIFGVWSRRQYLQSQPALWNPARSWAWTGATFAAIGLAGSIFALEFAYVSAYGRILRGLP